MPRRSVPVLRLALLLGAASTLAACDDGGDDNKPAPTIDTAWFAEGELGTIRAGATTEQRATFQAGLAVALKRFTPETGLGPSFNATSCASCHEAPNPGGGAPRYRDFYLFQQHLGDGTAIELPMGGVSHANHIGDGDPRPGQPANANIVARRTALPLFGVGAIASIDEAAILANADPDDRDGDGISGRPNYDRGFVGRLGRKAQTVSVEGFIRGPINNHIGVTTNPLPDSLKAKLPIPSVAQIRESALRTAGAPLGDFHTIGQPQAAAPDTPLFDTDDVPDPEMGDQDLFDIISWAMLLGAPRPEPDTPRIALGRQRFEEALCGKCHVPTLEGPGGLIPLYSDLLLHDMGEDMADDIHMALATGSEFRTQPLWGLAGVGPYLHDGRADTIDEAIRWHGGEAEASRERYVAMAEDDRNAILEFIDALGGKELDSEGLLRPNAPVPAAGEHGAPPASLAAADEARWINGRRLFDRNMTQDDGVGPFFNGDSCRACHFEPAIGGAGPHGLNAMRFGKWENGAYVPMTTGANLIHRVSHPMIAREEPPAGTNLFEPRQTPSIFGAGLIEGISDDTIRANADPEDLDGDGIRGIAHVLPDGQIGRFGWKGDVPSLREFARDALSNEVGMTIPEESAFRMGALTDDDDIPDPEISVAELDDLVFYLQNLAAPAPTGSEPAGEALFTQVGCAKCHIPELAGANGPVRLYSDLLIHEIRDPALPGVPSGLATSAMFRTPPLWGIRHTAPYMHDGLSTTLDASIRAHDRTAAASRDAYLALPPADQAAIIRFLETL